MQRIKLTNGCDQDLFCPFCGTHTVSEHGVEGCSHFIYMATDDGFEVISEALGFDGNVALGEDTIDEFTDKLDIDGSVKFAMYDPAPSEYGAYVGFVAAGCEKE